MSKFFRVWYKRSYVRKLVQSALNVLLSFPTTYLCKAGLFNNRQHLQSSSLREPQRRMHALSIYLPKINNRPSHYFYCSFLISIPASKCYFVIYNTFGNLVYFISLRTEQIYFCTLSNQRYEYILKIKFEKC